MATYCSLLLAVVILTVSTNSLSAAAISDEVVPQLLELGQAPAKLEGDSQTDGSRQKLIEIIHWLQENVPSDSKEEELDKDVPVRYYIDSLNSYLPQKRYIDGINSYLIPNKRGMGERPVETPDKRYIDGLNSYLLPQKRYIDSLNSYLIPQKRYIDSLNSYLLPQKRYIDNINSYLLPEKKYLNNKNSFMPLANRFPGTLDKRSADANELEYDLNKEVWQKEVKV